MAEYQACPVCHGVGSVSGGYFIRAGEFPYWASPNTLELCRVCQGKGLILRPEPVLQAALEKIAKMEVCEYQSGSEADDMQRIAQEALDKMKKTDALAPWCSTT